jgi:hypothetical protein
VEDYDRAKSLKIEIDVLRGEIYAKLEPYLDLAALRYSIMWLGSFELR